MALLTASPIDGPSPKAPEGMVWIPSGTFTMGWDGADGRPDERPAHQVFVDGFWIDETEVTNAEFSEFIKTTGYVTTAERQVDWEELKQQVPPGTPKPADELLQPGSMVFTPPSESVPLDDFFQWWQWVPGASWQHPEGPGSTIKGREDHPVVHVSWDDAVAYATWADKRLPTEAEWERAARFGQDDKRFTWGNEFKPDEKPRANIWQGEFPHRNTTVDGHAGTAPVGSFPPNKAGLHDMAGNTWEWTGDLYRHDAYAQRVDSGQPTANPTGPSTTADPRNPYAPVSRVQKGGSFLCHESYCTSYRPSAKMGVSPDSGLNHLGFRCVLPAPSITRTDVYTSGEDEYHTFRIPSIVVAPNGDLIAVCEGRRGGRGDSGDIDLVMRRSSDGGKTWSDLEVIQDDGLNTCGNPTLVVDETTGVLHLLSTRNLGHDAEHEIIEQTSDGSRTIWVMQSDDNGRTWSEARDITADVKLPDWTWYATGPGAGIQVKRGPHVGRLIIPCDHIEAGSKHYYSHVFYSDDHGRTWELGGSSPDHQVNECEVVEGNDGSLLLNMRNYDRSQRTRQVCKSTDGGQTWTNQRHDPTLIEPICQASIRRIREARGKTPGLVVFSNPASREGRVKMTLRGSTDDGATWPYARELYDGPSAYSCLVSLPDGDIGCLYEADGYGRIEFARCPTEWLTSTLDQD
ncbi:MAG: SUMF1/EgtB/PvdO family nonheme iron enzyme [Planctomycetota bacterium]|nr:SUMF1/EgtB/PvdO family nonheme iron enzyme [Planctomycetota bacterium]